MNKHTKQILDAFLYGAKYSKDAKKEASVIRRIASHLEPSNYVVKIPVYLSEDRILLTTTHTNVFGKDKIPHIIKVYLSFKRSKFPFITLKIDANKKPVEMNAIAVVETEKGKYEFPLSLCEAMQWAKTMHDKLGFDGIREGQYAQIVYEFLKNNSRNDKDLPKEISRVVDEIHIAPFLTSTVINNGSSTLTYESIVNAYSIQMHNKIEVVRNRHIYGKDGKVYDEIKRDVYLLGDSNEIS